MKKKQQNNKVSFYRKIKISLALMGIIPFLLAVYLVLREMEAPSRTMIACSALILFSILVGFILLRQSSDQLVALAKETSKVGIGDTPAPLHVQVDGELQDIALSFNAMVDRLNQANRDIQDQSIQLLEYAKDLSESYERLKEEEDLRTHLCRYIDADLVEKLMRSRDGQLLKNQRRIVTIMFADIRSFTAISEHMDPEDVVSMLNEYFVIMVDIVFKFNGMLDKLVGDQIMAVFGHMSGEKAGARAAVRAALEMQKATEALMAKRAAAGLPVFRIGIGINTGSAILGSVGSENRKDYTVIGDTVNAASRLEKHAAEREVVIGERTYGHLPRPIHAENRQELRMKNRSEPIVCYTLKTRRRQVTKKTEQVAMAIRLSPTVPTGAGC